VWQTFVTTSIVINLKKKVQFDWSKLWVTLKSLETSSRNVVKCE